MDNIAQEGDRKHNSKKDAANSCMVDVQDSCVICKGKHQLHEYKDFLAMSHNQKMAIIKKNALCINCLRQAIS